MKTATKCILMTVWIGIPPVAWAQVSRSDDAVQSMLDKAHKAAKSQNPSEAVESLAAALAAGLGTSAALTDPDLVSLHELPKFRALIKEHTREHKVDYAPRDEPGSPLRVTGRVLDEDGNPIANALVYVFQTNTKGIYSSAGGNATIGDSLNPRLFGYMRTDSDGTYIYNTIRPGEYLGGGPPAHIHYRVSADGYRERFTEIMFRDDPRVGSEASSSADGSIIRVDVKKEDDSTARCTADIVLKRR
jgi:protocatechuate 3,4-dioxygenase beta subunit